MRGFEPSLHTVKGNIKGIEYGIQALSLKPGSGLNSLRLDSRVFLELIATQGILVDSGPCMLAVGLTWLVAWKSAWLDLASKPRNLLAGYGYGFSTSHPGEERTNEQLLSFISSWTRPFEIHRDVQSLTKRLLIVIGYGLNFGPSTPVVPDIRELQ